MKKIYLFAMFILVGSFLLVSNVEAIGIISNPIDIQNALRGETSQDILKFFNSEETEMYYSFLAEGDIDGWVNFYEVDDLENPVTEALAKPQAYYDLAVLITVPEDTPNGEYLGKLTVVSKPAAAEGEESGAAVRQRVSREVYIKVTDQEDIQLDVSVIPQTFDLKRGENLKVRLIYDNSGNVSLKPQVDFKIKSGESIVYNAIYPYPEGEPKVKPGAQYEIPALEIPTSNLNKGSYRAELNFMHNGEVVLTKDFNFTVGSGSVLGISIGNFTINWWMMAIALLIIVVAIAIMVVKKRQKKIQI